MKGKLKISEKQFRDYLLDKYLNDNLEKVSDRELWSSEDFFDYTGMYSINKYTGERKILSTGTISYWKSKLNIKEKDVYDYHKKVTKKLKDIPYSQWSKMNNKGHKRKRTLTENAIKIQLIKYVGLPEYYKLKTLSMVTEIVYRTWKSLGLDAEVEMKKFYNKLKESAK